MRSWKTSSVLRHEGQLRCEVRVVNVRQREPRLSIPKVLKAAKGEMCTVQHPEHCNGNPETSVMAHSNWFGKGKGVKEDDLAVAIACSGCHDYFDRTRDEDRLYYWTRGHLRTLRRLYEKGILKA